MKARKFKTLVMASLLLLEFAGVSRQYERQGASGAVVSFGPTELLHRFQARKAPLDENRPKLKQTITRTRSLDQNWQRREAVSTVAMIATPIAAPEAVRPPPGEPLSLLLKPVLPGHFHSKK